MFGYAASGWTGTNTGFPAVYGPLANSMRDLILLTRVARDAKPWLMDPAIIQHIFERGTLSRKPTVGILYQSGKTPHPSIRRALREAVAKLRSAGFDIRDFVPPNFAEIKKVARQLFTLDGLSYPKREMEKAGEPVVVSVEKLGLWNLPPKKPEEIWEWNTRKLEIQKQILDAWNKAGVDVVLCPAGPYTAVLPGDWTSEIYTVAWNAVDVNVLLITSLSHSIGADSRAS